MTINVASRYLKQTRDKFAGVVSDATGADVSNVPNTLAGATVDNPANTNVAEAAPNPWVSNPTYTETAKKEEPAFSSTSGANVKRYIDANSANLGKDPGAISEAGRLYAELVTNGLKTPDAQSVNAQATEDTAAARRAYLARIQSEEAIGQSGFGMGTAQADRIRMGSQAGVNQANQAGQNSVNAYIRQRSEDNMNRAQGLETQQWGRNRDILGDAIGQDMTEYGRSERATDRGIAAEAVRYGKWRDSVGDTRYEQTYKDTRADVADAKTRIEKNDARTEEQRIFENQQVLKGSDDAAKRNLINSLPDGPAKNAVIRGLADGSLNASTALAQVMNADGTIKDEYRGKTPGELGIDAEREYAQQIVDLQDPNLKTSDPAAYLARVNAEILAKLQATNQPVNDATKAAEARTIEEKIRLGTPLNDAEVTAGIKAGVIKPVNEIKSGDAPSLLNQLVSFGDGTTGKVTDVVTTSKGDNYMVLDIDGKEVDYFPGRSDAFHIYTGGRSGDHWFKTKEAALDFLARKG